MFWKYFTSTYFLHFQMTEKVMFNTKNLKKYETQKGETFCGLKKNASNILKFKVLNKETNS